MVELSAAWVFVKTAQGSDEIATRRHGLSMRLRQVLILVDGRRSVADLARMVPETELRAHLPVLLEQGFVEVPGGSAESAGPGAGPGPVPAPGGAQPAGAPGPSAAESGPATRTAAGQGGASASGPRTSTLVPAHAAGAPPGAAAGGAAAPGPGPAAGAPGPGGIGFVARGGVPLGGLPIGGAPAPAAPAPPVQRRDLETVRRQLVRQLVDAIGPNSDAMAVRIERCRSVDEIRQLLPTIASLVEAIRGRTAMNAFMQQVGTI
jgi:hypothetical protein